MSVAAFTAFRLIQHLNRQECSLLMTGNHHLGNALSVLYDKRLLRQIYQHHTNLTTIIRIDSARCIQYRDTLLQSQSASRSYLCLIANRQCYM